MVKMFLTTPSSLQRLLRSISLSLSHPPLEADLSKIEMQNNRKLHAWRGRQPSHRLRGAVFASTVFPGYAKDAYPRLIFLHASGVASPKGCREISPGWSVLCDTRG